MTAALSSKQWQTSCHSFYKNIIDYAFFNLLKFASLGGLIGWLAWGSGDSVEQLLWILMVPLAWGLSESRVAASALMAGYYLAAARGLIAGTSVFYGEEAGLGLGLFFWSLACLLLTLPFVFLWTKNAKKKPWYFVFAVFISMIPPLAIVGWVNPVSVAGVLFPNLGWFGLVLMGAVFFFMVVRQLRSIAIVAALAVACNVISPWVSPQAPKAWQGINTDFPELSSGGGGDAGRLLASMKRVQWIKKYAESIPAGHVQVLPETVAGVFDALAKYELEETENALTKRGARLLVGAEFIQNDGRYQNALIVLGANKDEENILVQNIPVPYAMWKPWADVGAVGNFFGRQNVGEVNGHRVTAVICYEQLLAFSWAWSMLRDPDIFIAVSNVWWANKTSIPEIQLQMARVFGRLFGVGVIVSRNG